MKTCQCSSVDNSAPQTKRTQALMKPECALDILKKGNERFANKLTLRRDLKWQVEVTSCGQFPFAAVLSCIDSRVPTSLIFDQGIGDVFNPAIAGNFVNKDILGSLEFAYTSGVRLILVLGHTRCGAVNAAINTCDAKNSAMECSHILPMVKNICPAVKTTKRHKDEGDIDYETRVAKNNVILNIEKIRTESKCLKNAEKDGRILIMGGIYDISTGLVSFFEAPAPHLKQL